MNFSNRREEILAKLATKDAAEKAETVARKQELEMAQASQPIFHADHKIPKTRRELLSAGFLSGLAYAIVPSIFSLSAQRAFGAPVCAQAGTSSATRLPGYLHIEISGGAGLSGNYMIGKQASGFEFAPLAATAYPNLGLGTSQIPGKVALDASIKGQFHPASSFLAGMKSVMSAAALAKSVAVGMAGISSDDNSNNPLNPSQLVAKVAGLSGSLIQLVGSGTQANTLGKTAPLNVAEDPSLAKALIADESSLTNLVNPGLIATRFNRNSQATLAAADLAHKLSASKLARYPLKDMNQQVKDLIECGYLGAKDLLKLSADTLTPSSDKLITDAAFNNITFATLNQPKATTQKAMIISKLLVDGFATCGTLEIGGGDYHGQGRANQDIRDFSYGQAVGLALEIAHRKGSPLFVALTSDGSVSSNGAGGANDRFDWTSDNGSHGMVLMIAIGGKERPATSFLQIGAYNDTGAVDTSMAPVTARTASAQALCVAFNYASFAGRMAQFEAALAASGSPNPFKGAEGVYRAFDPGA